MLCLVYAHPYPDRSRANRALLRAVTGLPQLTLRSLYDLYPDFSIDVETEQAQLEAASLVIFQHPLYWYSVPGLLKHYFDKVLARGWAYGGGAALRGKRCLWVITTGGEAPSYAPGQLHGRPLPEYLPPFEQTARFCGMSWEPPLVLYGGRRIGQAELTAQAQDYRRRLEALLEQGEGQP